MRLLDISRFDKDELIEAATHLEDAPPSERGIMLMLIREKAEEIGCSSDVEEFLSVMQSASSGNALHAAELWTPPEELSPPPPPSFSCEWLPGIFGEYAAELTYIYQVPSDLPALLILGAVSAAAAKLYEIVPYPGRDEQTQLFTCVSLPPGERKSPVFKEICRPFARWEKEENERRKLLIERRKTEREIRERAKRKAIEKGEEAEALRLTDELLSLPEIAPVQLFASDATPEALAPLLKDNGERIALMDAEGSIFASLAGKYNNGKSDFDTLLHGYNAETIRCNRIGRGVVTVESPSITAVLTVQPSIIREIFNNDAMRERGFLARWLFAQPEPKVGSRIIHEDGMSEESRAAYDERIYFLLNKPRSEHPVPLLLTPQAREYFHNWSDEVEKRQSKGGDLEGLNAWSWSTKLPGNTLRFAAALCVMKEQSEIDASTLLTAIEIARWAIEHARAVSFEVSSSSESNAQKVLKKIIVKGWRAGFSESSLRQSGIERTASFRTGGRFDPRKLASALEELEERGYLRKDANVYVDGTRRREWYYVNPHVFKQKDPREEMEELTKWFNQRAESTHAAQ